MSDTTPDLVSACPECDVAAVRKKVDKMDSCPRTYPEDYRCVNCLAHFDEPVERERKQPARSRTCSEAVNRLLDADADTEIRARGDD